MLTLTGTGLAAGLLFGRDAYSYVTSSARQMQNAVHDAVPVEFQLHRAQDLVNDIVPEIQANVRAIAQQEVQIESLKADIADSTKSLDDEKTRMAKLRDCLNTAQTSFTFADCTYTRQQLKDDLGRRFDASKEAAVVLAGNQRLLQNQQNSLVAAEQMLERTRSEKQNLESQIATLEAQNRLVQAASVGTASEIDNTKLAQSQKLIADIKTQLDVAERVLAHESHFVEPIQIDTVSDKDLIGQVDAYLASADPAAVKADASAVKADPSVANADPAAVSAAH
jgi:chromosome segregation ATPase